MRRNKSRIRTGRTRRTCRKRSSDEIALVVKFACACLSCLLLAALTGCASYQVGNESLYRPDIFTVAVPPFQSESLRRHLGERLTEAVVKEIELKTPYKVSRGINADSQLNGRIVHDAKYAITENVNDELRDIELEYFVEFSWRNRQGNPLIQEQMLTIPNQLINLEVGQSVHFVPEGGQSRATAEQVAIQRLAEQIVASMELPW